MKNSIYLTNCLEAVFSIQYGKSSILWWSITYKITSNLRLIPLVAVPGNKEFFTINHRDKPHTYSAASCNCCCYQKSCCECKSLICCDEKMAVGFLKKGCSTPLYHYGWSGVDIAHILESGYCVCNGYSYSSQTGTWI